MLIPKLPSSFTTAGFEAPRTPTKYGNIQSQSRQECLSTIRITVFIGVGMSTENVVNISIKFASGPSRLPKNPLHINASWVIMTNLAAIIPAASAPLELCEVELYTPGPHELLVKNEVIAYNPVEFKIAKLGLVPVDYPAIIGSTFGGTIEAVGKQVIGYHIGDRVVVSKRFGVVGNQYGAYQRYVVVSDIMISKVPDAIDLAIPASLMMNLTCVAGLFVGRLGLDRPNLNGPIEAKDQKILIYGGSSSFGSLSVQFLTQAGYHVITTSSPKNRTLVASLKPQATHDHTLETQDLVEALIADGPYEVVVDMISSPDTVGAVAKVLAAQGGGTLYTMQPASEAEELPAGVTRVFEPWSEPLYEDEHHELQTWLTQQYMPLGLLCGAIIPLPVQKVSGGLNGVNQALTMLQEGLSGVRLVANPWE